MAGDWIKMRGNLWDDPRVMRLCDLTDQGEAAIVGALYWLWATADQHTEDGILPGLTLRQIDRKTGVQGFAQALCDIGWLSDDPEGVRIVGFEEHNGASAKRRSLDAQRKANVRSVSASQADTAQTQGGQIAPTCGAREEKSREDKNSPSLRSGEKRASAPARPDDVDAQVWADWLQLRNRKRAPVTATVLDTARQESAKAGLPLNDFLRVWCARGSQGLEAAWLRPDERRASSAPAGKHSGFAAKNYREGVEADGSFV